MKTAQIRQKFLDYFHRHGHEIVPSSSLIPHDDPTLLFTNAGMNQFKDVFLGYEKRDYHRATTSQKCVRAGGKHNDLENVGYTARHHTFFEMLGNFSFGDYFKREAIHFAWEFLTSAVWMNIPKDKLLVTVYATDNEAYDIWAQEIKVPPEKIIRIGDNKGAPYASDNFWQMGDTGPCGPCTEIFYDHGEHILGGPPGSVDEDGDRFIEIWNCVFMQFNRDEQNNMHPLPMPSVDTGMGLERITAVIQQVHSNYEIDLFVDLLQATAREAGVPYNQATPSLKVIADHIRACAFLIADGVLPANEGRGYVLRRIIRRAVRHGYKLAQKPAFFHKLVPDLVKEMGEAFPELKHRQHNIIAVLKQEESRFEQTLSTGLELLEKALASGKKTLSGDIIFKLYDTYGFPYDLTADICRERDILLDEAGFDAEMQIQKERARAASGFKVDNQLEYAGIDTIFEGYSHNQTTAKILALYQGNHPVAELKADTIGSIVLDVTPFYAESGGQIGDTGEILSAQGTFIVNDTQKIKSTVIVQHGQMSNGNLKVGDTVQAIINTEKRAANMRNHSATHLLHHAMQQVLGNHVEQKGSLVTSERTRFDFTHNVPVSTQEITKIEQIVNRSILSNVEVHAQIMNYHEAIEHGAVALFGEKYGDQVRVLQMGAFSTELCGGTHVNRTGDIGLFKIISESGVAAGVRRIEAITGLVAVTWVQQQQSLLNETMNKLKAQTPSDILTKIDAVQATQKTLEKKLSHAKNELANLAGAALLDQAESVGAFTLIVAELTDTNPDALREIAESLQSKLNNGVILLASVIDGKAALCATVSKEVTKQIKASDLIKMVAEQIGGKGGGKADLAQAGGSNIKKLPEALSSVKNWIVNQ